MIAVVCVSSGLAIGVNYRGMTDKDESQQKAEILMEFQRRHKYERELLIKNESHVKSIVERSIPFFESSKPDSDSVELLFRKCVMTLLENENLIHELQELGQGDSILFLRYKN